MKGSQFVAILLFAFCAAASADQPRVVSFWESWNMNYPTDYAALLPNASYGGLDSPQGANQVNIAYGDYTFTKEDDGELYIGYVNYQYSSSGQQYTPKALRADIDAVHKKGAAVVVSFGGAFSMNTHIKNEDDAKAFCANAKTVVE